MIMLFHRKMEVELHESAVFAIIVQYLESHNLYLTSSILELETKTSFSGLANPILTLRDFSFDGNWTGVRKWVQPFINLYKDAFPLKTLLSLLFRQRFCEICLGSNHKDVLENMQDIVDEVRSHHNENEYEEIIKTTHNYCKTMLAEHQSHYFILMTRRKTFMDVLHIVSPFFEMNDVEVGIKNEGLTSLLVKSLMLDECESYCYKKATGLPVSTGTKVVADDRLKNSSLRNVSSSLLYWVFGISDDDLFTKDFFCKDLQVRITPFPTHSEDNSFLQRQANNGNLSNLPVEQHQSLSDTLHMFDLTNESATVNQSMRNCETPYTNPTHTSTVTFTKQPSHSLPTKDAKTLSSSAKSLYSTQVASEIHTKSHLDSNDVGDTEAESLHHSNSSIVKDASQNNINDSYGLVQSEQPTALSDGNDLVIHQRKDHSQQMRVTDKQNMQISSPPSAVIQNKSIVVSKSNDIFDQANMASPVRQSASIRDSYADFIMEQSEAKQGYRKLMEQVEEKENKALSLQKELMGGLSERLDSTNQSTHQASEFPPPSVNSTHQAISSPLKSSHHVPIEPPTSLRKCDDISSTSPPLVTYSPVEKTEDSAVIRSVAFHPLGHAVAVGSNSRVLKLCSISNRSLSTQPSSERAHAPDWMQIIIKKSQVHRGSIYGLAWNDHGNILVSCSNDTLLKIYNYDSETSSFQGPQFQLNHHDGMIRDVTFLPGYGSGSVLASGGSGDFVVYTYACDVDTVVHQLSGHSDQVLSLFSWDNGLLASSSQDRSVRMWDLRLSKCASVLGFGTTTDQHSIPTSVCVDKAGRYMAVGRDDHVISIYDITAGKTIVDYPVHKGEVRSVRFNPVHPSLLLSSSYDGTAIVTRTDPLMSGVGQSDMTSQSSLCRFHSDKVIQARWHPSGRAFATTSADQSCVIWGVTDT